jgi:folate-binding protein YgfZ
MTHMARLHTRGAISITGVDATRFLQGLICNDMEKIPPSGVIYAALLTPQGKYLFDFFIVSQGDGYILDCEGARLHDLIKRLLMYRLRMEVEISDLGASHEIFAAWPMRPADLPAGVIIYADPRLSTLGFRIIAPKNTIKPNADFDAYDLMRLRHGITDASRDIEVDKTLILEANFEPLNGVDFNKGCYVGQEVTARMKHRGTMHKRLLPIVITGTLDANKVKSHQGNVGLAMLRLDALGQGSLSCGADVVITPSIPDWLKPFMG